jgi:hypothetical protein
VTDRLVCFIDFKQSAADIWTFVVKEETIIKVSSIS